MAYCTRAEVESQYGVENVAEWADLDNDADAAKIAARIAAEIASADTEIDSILRASPYRVPLRTAAAAVPEEITSVAVLLVGEGLYTRKAMRNRGDGGEAGDSLGGDRQEALGILEEIALNKRRISAVY